MVFQRVVCLLALVAAALVFVYSLGIMTDVYDGLFRTFDDLNVSEASEVDGAVIYQYMNSFNRSFLKRSIVMILLAALLFITNTHSRRRYYISNYVSTGAFSLFAIVTMVWASRWISSFKAFWKTNVNFTQLAEFSEMWDTRHLDANSTFWFDIRLLVFGISWIAVILLIANLVLKIKLEKTEEELVKGGN